MDIEIIRRGGRDGAVLIRDPKSDLTVEAWTEPRSTPVVLSCKKDGRETQLTDMSRRQRIEAEALLRRAMKAIVEAAVTA
jgi:hypothetical protein